MTLEELIEYLAETYHRLSVNRRVAHLEYWQLPEFDKERTRVKVREHFLPYFIQYGEEWLNEKLENQQLFNPVDAWRNDHGY